MRRSRTRGGTWRGDPDRSGGVHGARGGLTATCLGLVGALQERGVDVGFFKPLARGTGSDRSTALIRLTSTLRPPEPIPAGVVERRLS
jgi:phosphate acetyltransferase